MTNDERGHPPAQQFAEYARAMHDGADVDATLEAAFKQIKSLLPAIGHVSVTVRRRRNRYMTLASDGERAERADQLQYELGEGPCVSSASEAGDGWHYSGDLSRDQRWPIWGGRATVETGVNSVLSIALLRHGEPYGAINLYSAELHQFTDPEDLDRALLWAHHFATALSAAREVENLETAIGARHSIGVAQGILMDRLDLTLDASFVYLTRAASTREQRLHFVALEIVRTRRIPDL